MGKVSKIHWNERVGAAANARRRLPLLLRNYFVRVRLLLAADPPPAELHVIRLASKKLRYTLELFRPCYGPGLKTRLAELQDLQEILGDVNDCCAAERVVACLAPESPSRDRAEAFLRHRASANAAKLRKQWFDRFDAPGKEQWWLQYCAGRAKAPKSRL
jgi:CHAD domain-containing protein